MTATPKKILIVEDEDNIALAMEFFVGRHGYHITRVVDGDAAIEALGKAVPDLLVLDVTLPKRSGYDVCQHIRNDAAMNGAKILIMTARGGKMERTKALALGADAFLTKPFASADLLTAIKDLIGDATA